MEGTSPSLRGTFGVEAPLLSPCIACGSLVHDTPFPVTWISTTHRCLSFSYSCHVRNVTEPKIRHSVESKMPTVQEIIPVKTKATMTLSQTTNELIPPPAPHPLGENEAKAPVAILSPAKRTALLACLKGGGSLHKQRGVWVPSSIGPSDKRISGITVADLGRDGMLTLTFVGRHASAHLTTRGSWFARTAAAEIAK